MSSLLSPSLGEQSDEPCGKSDAQLVNLRRRKQVRILALLVFWFASVTITLIAIGSSTVPAGTTVSGVDIGGLDRESAVNRLTGVLGEPATRPIGLKLGDATATVLPDALGVSFNAEATVDSVITNRLNPFDIASQFFGGSEAVPVIRLDQQMFVGKVAALAEKYSTEMSEPEIVYEGTVPQLNAPIVGSRLNQDEAQAVILSHYLRDDPNFQMPFDEVAPTVDVEQAKNVQGGLAQQAVAAPINMRVGDQTVEIDQGHLSSALTFQVSDGQLKPVIDGAALHTSLTDELESIDTPAQNASWDVSSGSPVLVPSSSGNGVNSSDMADSIVAVLGNGPEDRNIDVKIGPLEPSLTTEQAAALNIREQISSFTQPFDYAPYRIQNIGLAAKKLQATLLMPGETFSFNDRVGKRTVANGFTTGPVVGEGGRFQEELGGGVSAAATTTWTAAFYAGLESVEHGSHLIWISRYQPGLEATVNWGYLDLRFKNPTSDGVLITTKMTNGGLTVSMWGTKQYDEIKAESGEKYNVTPYAQEQDTSTSCLPQNGSDGFTIDVDRVFIKDGQEAKRETFTTGYIPGAAVKCVGSGG